MKEGKDGGATAFKLTTVTVGIDDDGDVITSCVVEAATAAAAAMTEPTRIAMEVLRALIDTKAVPAPLSVLESQVIDSLQVVPESVWRDACYLSTGMVKPGSNKDAKRKAFSRAVEDLEKRGLARIRADVAWVL